MSQTKSHAKKELSPEDRIKNSRQLTVVNEWLNLAYPDFSAEMSASSTNKGKGHKFVLEIFQVFDFLNHSSFSRFKYEGSDPDSVAESALADLLRISKNDSMKRPDPYEVLCDYVKNKYSDSGLETFEQVYYPNMQVDTHLGRQYHVIVGKESGKWSKKWLENKMQHNDPRRKYLWVVAYNYGINYQQAADRVLTELKFKEMNNLLWVNDLGIEILEEEVLKNEAKKLDHKKLPKGFSPPPEKIKIEKSLGKIVPENTKGDEKTFYISALLMTPERKAEKTLQKEPAKKEVKLGEGSGSEPAKRR